MGQFWGVALRDQSLCYGSLSSLLPRLLDCVAFQQGQFLFPLIPKHWIIVWLFFFYLFFLKPIPICRRWRIFYGWIPRMCACPDVNKLGVSGAGNGCLQSQGLINDILSFPTSISGKRHTVHCGADWVMELQVLHLWVSLCIKEHADWNIFCLRFKCFRKRRLRRVCPFWIDNH